MPHPRPLSSLFAPSLLALPLALGLERPLRAPPPGDDDAAPAPSGDAQRLSPEDAARLERGRVLFSRDFHRSSGLGTPEMNADSCRACHRDPVVGGAGGLELNVSRFARDHGGAGPYEDLPGGQTLSKLRPPHVLGREEYVPGGPDVFEQRQTPSLLGGGLIDGIPDASILQREDPLDLDGDGIRGVARRLTIDGVTELGRFGWKGQVPHLRDFVRDALGGELGLTTPDDRRGFALLSDADASADPELDQEAVDDLTFFLANLPAPVRAASLEPEVLRGEFLFSTLGCARCHVPFLEGARGPVWLYSDLLLHDVWPDTFRGMSEPGAGPGVYRTPPLWGVGTTAPYLHDGRASTLRAAILSHDGDARPARRGFELLSPADKNALIAFLEDL